MLSHLIFTRNQVGMQVNKQVAVKHQGFILDNLLPERAGEISDNLQCPCVVNDTRTLRSVISKCDEKRQPLYHQITV